MIKGKIFAQNVYFLRYQILQSSSVEDALTMALLAYCKGWLGEGVVLPTKVVPDDHGVGLCLFY